MVMNISRKEKKEMPDQKKKIENERKKEREKWQIQMFLSVERNVAFKTANSVSNK